WTSQRLSLRRRPRKSEGPTGREGDRQTGNAYFDDFLERDVDAKVASLFRIASSWRSATAVEAWLSWSWAISRSDCCWWRRSWEARSVARCSEPAARSRRVASSI